MIWKHFEERATVFDWLTGRVYLIMNASSVPVLPLKVFRIRHKACMCFNKFWCKKVRGVAVVCVVSYWVHCHCSFLLSGPLTCCSRLRMTATAWCRISNLVWGLSLFRWSCTILPSSLNASLMSRTRRRSRALLAILRSLSLSIFCSGVRSSSSLLLRWSTMGTSRNKGRSSGGMGQEKSRGRVWGLTQRETPLTGNFSWGWISLTKWHDSLSYVSN